MAVPWPPSSYSYANNWLSNLGLLGQYNSDPANQFAERPTSNQVNTVLGALGWSQNNPYARYLANQGSRLAAQYGLQTLLKSNSEGNGLPSMADYYGRQIIGGSGGAYPGSIQQSLLSDLRRLSEETRPMDLSDAEAQQYLYAGLAGNYSPTSQGALQASIDRLYQDYQNLGPSGDQAGNFFQYARSQGWF